MFDKFTDTIFIKKDSKLERQFQELNELIEKNPNDDDLQRKLKLCKYGLDGEKKIEFQLQYANIGMYVLHDINMEYQDLKAQIDYIIITPAKTYFLECKNLVGNITIDSNGNFIREYTYGDKKITEGIENPYTQAQRHVEVLKKIWMERNTGFLDKTLKLKNFDKWIVPLVVLAYDKSIINDSEAPEDIKKHVVKFDRLVDYLKNDINNTDKDFLWNKKQMEENAKAILTYYNR